MGKHTELMYDHDVGRFEWAGIRCKPAIEAEISSASYDAPWLEFGDIDPDELCRRYNNHARLVEALRDACGVMEAFNRAPGATRDEWEFECEVEEIKTLLAQIDGELE